MATRTYDLLMSDIQFGHPALGWIDRKQDENPDDEDLRYQRFLREKNIKARVYHCQAHVEEQ